MKILSTQLVSYHLTLVQGKIDEEGEIELTAYPLLTVTRFVFCLYRLIWYAVPLLLDWVALLRRAAESVKLGLAVAEIWAKAFWFGLSGYPHRLRVT